MSGPGVVFDTNVLISAALRRHSVPRQAFDSANAYARILTSEACLQELTTVLQRPKFSRYVTPFEVSLFLNAYALRAKLVPVTHTVADCRDPNDNKFLELALSGEAAWIVTGDADLLVLHPYRGIALVTPAEFTHASL